MGFTPSPLVHYFEPMSDDEDADPPAPPPGPAGWAAGVLPVCASPSDGRCMLLLGQDSRSKGGKWSDFAGGGEACDASPLHTAVRELDEETGGLLRWDAGRLEEGLRRGDVLEFRSVTPSGRDIRRFVVRVPFDPSLPSRFAGSKDDEKVALGWFPMSAMPPLRHVFASQMWRDRHDIAAFCRAGGASRGASPGA